MKKYSELNRKEELDVNVQEETSLMEKPGFGVRIKEAGSKVIHNKWVKRAAAGAALIAAGAIGFVVGDKFGPSNKDDDDTDFEIIDLDAEIEESPAE